VGIDHESFHEHPWLSVASFKVPLQGRYLVELSGQTRGQYAVSPAQIEIVREIAPLVVTTLLRLIGVGLGLVALVELYRRDNRRRRRKMFRMHG
jgi:hypothetical protein